MIIFLLFFFLYSVIGYPIEDVGVLYIPNKAISLNDGYRLTIQGLLAGILMLISGLLLIFRTVWDHSPEGRRVRQLVGFICAGFITWVMLANFEPPSTYGYNRWTIYLVVPWVSGVLFALFMHATIHLYIMLLGGLGGLAFGLWVLGWSTGFTIDSVWGRGLFLSVLVIFSMFYSLYQSIGPILGTSIVGSYLLFMGLDVFFHTGFLYCFTTALDVNIAHVRVYRTTREIFIMQGCLIIAVIVSYAVQTLEHCYNRILAQHSTVLGGSLIRFPMIPITLPFWNKGPPVIEAPVIPQPTVIVPQPTAVSMPPVTLSAV